MWKTHDARNPAIVAKAPVNPQSFAGRKNNSHARCAMMLEGDADLSRNRSREEQETILRWDETDAPALLWTASPRQAARWQKLGYALNVEPGGWRAEVPKVAIRPLRRLVDGHVVRQKGASRSVALKNLGGARRKSAGAGLDPSPAGVSSGTA
jgi:hypothetical protein